MGAKVGAGGCFGAQKHHAVMTLQVFGTFRHLGRATGEHGRGRAAAARRAAYVRGLLLSES